VYFNAVLAAKFDPTLPEATNRSAILAANISSARTGDNLREDVRWRNEWVARLAETEKYVKNYNDYYNKYYTDYYNYFYKKYTDNWNQFIQTLPELPNTLFYVVDARNYGGTNYTNNTTNYTGIKTYLYPSPDWIQQVQTAIQTMDAPINEVRRTVQAEQSAIQAALYEVVTTVNNGLNATGQRTKWGLQPLNVGVTTIAYNNSFWENRRQKQGNQNFSVVVELVNNQNDKMIGRSTFQTSRTYSITNRGLSVSNNEQKSVDFTNVNINDLPPSDDQLLIRIASINGTAAETAVKNGILYINPVSAAEWNFNFDCKMQNGQITQYNGKGGISLIIPHTIFGEPITSIGDNTFYSKSLTAVAIPDSVTTIGKLAFANNQLTSVTIPNSVTLIDEHAFIFNRLTSVTIPNSVTTIRASAFAYNQLASVTIPNSITTIGEGAFANNKLTSIVMPENVSIHTWTDLNFDKFYNSNGQKAGTYTYNDRSKVWSYSSQ
ncbi:MAG: leucine-rich repeat domain-containing protein, partial [Treponema sp.]|jgi:hypothetical protein|nr:leucine-rich repeat domain-containing protein [Treponema sp.]